MNELASFMESTYSTAKICAYGEDLSSCDPLFSLGGKFYCTSNNTTHIIFRL